MDNEPLTESKKPYEDYLSRLDKALRSIDRKTSAFQIDVPTEAKAESGAKSSFEQAFDDLVRFAEHIDSKLKF